MTQTAKEERSDTSFLSAAVFILSTVLLITHADAVTESVIFGIKLSVTSIIPTLFPFIILSDYMTARVVTNKKSLAKRSFERIFGIPGSSMWCFITGAVCGFPLGVRSAVELYQSGRISRDDLERLIGFVNNPSLAFVISAVGLGMCGSIGRGIMLYISVLISALLVAIIFAKKSEKTQNTDVNMEQNFTLVDSIKNAGLASISISSYIIFFSTAIGLARSITDSEIIILIFSSLSEVGNAASAITKSTYLPPVCSYGLLGFSLGFSGLSVHLQAMSFIPPEVSKKRYLIMKILQGIFAGALSSVLCLCL